MDEKATISLVISGWTYTVLFPSRRHDQETIICSGHAHLVVEEDDEVLEKELYLEITRTNTEGQKSTYLIKNDGIDVSISVGRDDFSRIFQELKDHDKIRECVSSIEFEGPAGEGKVHEFVDFQLALAVDKGRYGQ